jgi:hypothetical protein
MNKGDLPMTLRTSPLEVSLQPEETVIRGGYEVALTYLGERGLGYPFLVDISHVPKWILQGRDLEGMQPAGVDIPANPQAASLRKGILAGRLTPHEGWLMALGDEIPSFNEPGFTRVTDGYAAMALVGHQVWEVLNKLSPVDMEAPAQEPLCVVQAPVEDVPCLLVKVMAGGAAPGLILCVERAYGPFILGAILDAGREFWIAVAGWRRFREWLPLSPHPDPGHPACRSVS